MGRTRGSGPSSRPARRCRCRPGRPRRSRCQRRATPHWVTFRNASATMPLLIFDAPISRSVNVIGTSRHGIPPARPPCQVDLEAVALRLDLVSASASSTSGCTPGSRR